MTKCCHLKVVILYCISLTDHYSFLEGREGGGREGGAITNKKFLHSNNCWEKLQGESRWKKKSSERFLLSNPLPPSPPPPEKKIRTSFMPQKIAHPLPPLKKIMVHPWKIPSKHGRKYTMIWRYTTTTTRNYVRVFVKAQVPSVVLRTRL